MSENKPEHCTAVRVSRQAIGKTNRGIPFHLTPKSTPTSRLKVKTVGS